MKSYPRGEGTGKFSVSLFLFSHLHQCGGKVKTENVIPHITAYRTRTILLQYLYVYDSVLPFNHNYLVSNVCISLHMNYIDVPVTALSVALF